MYVTGNGNDHESRLPEDPRIWEREQFRIGNWFQTNLYQDGGESEECEKDETLDASGPGPASGEEGFEHEREDYSTDGASCACDACCVAALGHEEVANCCGGGSDD
jgi:hypothetical protein